MFEQPECRVILKGFTKVIYVEGEKRAEIDAEPLTNDKDLAIYLDSLLEWKTPVGSCSVTEDEKRRMKIAIERELNENGIAIDWA